MRMRGTLRCSRLMRTLLLLSVAFALTACPSPTPRPEPFIDEDGGMLGTPRWAEGTLKIGTTDDQGEVFQEIGAQIELHRGPQGGNHTYAKYKVTGQTARDAVFENRVRRAKDGLLVSRGTRTMDVVPGDGGVWLNDYSITMFLCPTPTGINIVGEPLVFEVTAKAANGEFLGRSTATSTISCSGCEVDCGG